MTTKTVKRLLWLLVLLSLVPGLVLAVNRVLSEGRSATVTLLLDHQALTEQAAYAGVRPEGLAQRYREAGLNGLALYERTLEALAEEGKIALLSGNEARLALPNAEVPPRSLLVRELEPGALKGALAKNAPRPRTLRAGGGTWYVFPDPGDGDGARRPAGPDMAEVRAYAAAGWDLAYRPANYPGLRDVGADFPAAANYLIHEGLEVAGHPNALSETVAASQDYITGLIEGTQQSGMGEIIGEVPAARVFSISQDWLNTLPPGEVVDKYLLAANERGARLLYLRPYTEETAGDMFENTERLIRELRAGLGADGYRVGEIEGLSYSSPTPLRALCAVGVLAGLALLATLYPGAWGVLVAGGVLALGVLAGGGLNWDALALASALTFPVLGYALLQGRLWSLPLATLISLTGAVLLAGVGSDRSALLAASPFAGVAATLVVPPLLFAFHYALRYRPPARWVTDFWNHPVRLGHVVIASLGLAALALVLLRRGNFPLIGASEAELGLRALLSESFARPRFKELLGHPLAVLALTNPGWAAWIRGVLLTGGVVAQASLVNSFSHYHTPLLVSLERTLVALALGLLLGLLLTLLLRLTVRGVVRWLGAAPAR